MATRKSEAVKFEFSSSEDLKAILKSHKANFPMFGGSNNRTSGWFTHSKRKPIYEIIPELVFAMWNESLRMDNDFSENDVRWYTNIVYKECFRRKVQDFEMVRILTGFEALHNEALMFFDAQYSQKEM